ncbi:LLM class flavin-dependent oxidoreductase [Ornithinibacillus sp. 4-3]|uniref:LLM class flavin-dependent oxidoreductase n=1 Tax=Ornithinibacillus sp. 4-3 TaxID=3231488 RepID=A0AB39HKU8_9BACI
MTRTFQGTPLSVLDLAPINEGHSASESFQNSVQLAQHVEKWGFNRYWLAEHHNMPGIASSATSVVIGHIAGATKHIRVGAGGIMLPNHATLVIAEQFGTLEAMYPGRIDLGLGRAPGTDQYTAYALRRTLNQHVEEFPTQVEELQKYFAGDPNAYVRAIPGEGADVPIWLLGSSDFGARLAAKMGLPYAFASHFSPEYTIPALRLYKERFEPSEVLSEPYAMVGVNVIAADTVDQANYVATSMQQQFLNLRKGKPAKLQAPIDNIDIAWSLADKEATQNRSKSNSTMIGDAAMVKEKLAKFIEETGANEVIINSQIYHLEDRLRSYEIISEMME